uniref:Potassium channel domain-containing protein n=1 Tax=Daphnia galeata TaxID=27404 RepID=A0A8J2S4C3_9CRUS|nr:unnamed protein product [Daphnia galeata]
MGWKSSLAIKFHLGFWFYLVGGGAVYYYIEDPLYHLPPQPKTMTINATFCQHLVNLVENYIRNIVNVPLEPNDSTVRKKVTRDSCNDLTNSGKSEENGNHDVAWEFSSALFLCMTILTTIGYGCFSPNSSWGKVFCIFYGLIGIPICGILLANTSDYFSNGFLRLYKQRQSKQQRDKWHGIFIAAIIFLLPGLVVFFFIPAATFTYLEDWSYLDATYFSFVTLTTIGFGDIIAAQETNYPQLWLYRIGWIVWVMLGIAYWVTIISFITKALRSKRLRERWEKTSHAISLQAKEMRRIVKQLSTNDLNGNFAFTALKSKIAFDFSSKLSTFIGSIRAERKRQPPPDE